MRIILESEFEFLFRHPVGYFCSLVNGKAKLDMRDGPI